MPEMDDANREPTREEVDRMEGPVLLSLARAGALSAGRWLRNWLGCFGITRISATSRSRTGRAGLSAGRSASSSGRTWSSSAMAGSSSRSPARGDEVRAAFERSRRVAPFRRASGDPALPGIANSRHLHLESIWIRIHSSAREGSSDRAMVAPPRGTDADGAFLCAGSADARSGGMPSLLEAGHDPDPVPRSGGTRDQDGKPDLGTAAFVSGYQVQDSPVYGAGRGAAIAAYTRFDREPILEAG